MTRLIILAAGMGSRLRPLTDDRPKCLVELAGKPLLAHQIATARAAGITDIVVVGGYRAAMLRDYPVTVVENPAFETTNMVESLFAAERLFGDGFVLAYGDIVYGPAVLDAVLGDRAPIAVAVDLDWHAYWSQRFADPLDDAETLRLGTQGRILDIGRKPTSLAEIEAQYLGLLAFRGSGVAALRAAHAAIHAQPGGMDAETGRSVSKLYMTDLLRRLIARGEAVTAVPVRGGWVEVDSTDDLALAERLLAADRLSGGLA